MAPAHLHNWIRSSAVSSTEEAQRRFVCVWCYSTYDDAGISFSGYWIYSTRRPSIILPCTYHIPTQSAKREVLVSGWCNNCFDFCFSIPCFCTSCSNFPGRDNNCQKCKACL